jgi:hypothetical protein
MKQIIAIIVIVVVISFCSCRQELEPGFITNIEERN